MEVAIRSAPCVAPDMLWDDPNLKPNEFTADRRGLAVAITMPGENYQRVVHGLDLAGLYLAAVDNVETCLRSLIGLLSKGEIKSFNNQVVLASVLLAAPRSCIRSRCSSAIKPKVCRASVSAASLSSFF